MNAERHSGSTNSMMCHKTVQRLRNTYFKHKIYMLIAWVRGMYCICTCSLLRYFHIHTCGMYCNLLSYAMFVCLIWWMRSNFDAVEIYSCKFCDSHWCHHIRPSICKHMCVYTKCKVTQIMARNWDEKKKQSQLQLSHITIQYSEWNELCAAAAAAAVHVLQSKIMLNGNKPHLFCAS